MKTEMKENKGFTLIEVIVAFAVIAIAVFVFTPIIAYSFNMISDMGQTREDIYEQRKDIEIKIAGNNSEGTDELKIVFEKGSDHEIVSAYGTLISDSVSKNILSFVTNTKGDSVQLAIRSRTAGYTNKFSEDSWNDITDKIVDVLTDNELFTDVTDFSVKSNDGTVVISDAGFVITDAGNAYFTLPDEALPASGSPYKVCYEDYYAYMFVSLSSFDGVGMIAVGSNNRLILAEGFENNDPTNIKFYDGGTINDSPGTVINDIVWIPDTSGNPNAGKFVAVGADGYYLEIGETVAQGSDFNEVDITQKIFTPGTITSLMDFTSLASTGAGTDPVFTGRLSYLYQLTQTVPHSHANAQLNYNNKTCKYHAANNIPCTVANTSSTRWHWFINNAWASGNTVPNGALYAHRRQTTFNPCGAVKYDGTVCTDANTEATHTENATTETSDVTADISSQFKLEGGTLISAIDNSPAADHNYVDVAYGPYSGANRTIILDAAANTARYRDGNGSWSDLETGKAGLKSAAIGTMRYYWLWIFPREASAYVIVYGTSAALHYGTTGTTNIDLGYSANSVAYANKGSYNNTWVIVGDSGYISYSELYAPLENRSFTRVTTYIDSADGSTKNISTLDSYNLNEVVCINDRFFAVGDGGLILSSGDGKIWYRHYIYDENDNIVSGIDLNSIAGR